MTEPETAEQQEQPRKRGRRAAQPAESSDGKRAVGHWVAKLPDGRISMQSSELAALRDACPVGAVGPINWGEPIPKSGEDYDVTKTQPEHRGYWAGRSPSSGLWAGFEREIQARRYACPEGKAQFVRNGETISL